MPETTEPVTSDPTIPSRQRQIVLRSRPTGLVSWDDLELIEGPVPELEDGQALLRHEMWSMDATVRSWLNDSDGYLPAVELGDVVRASGIVGSPGTELEFAL